MTRLIGEVNQEIYFGFPADRLPSITDVSNSLIASEAMFCHAMQLFRTFTPELNDISIAVHPQSIEIGSLKNGMLIRFFFGGPDGLTAAVDDLREVKGVKCVLEYKKTLAAAFLLLAISAPIGGIAIVKWGIDKFAPQYGKPESLTESQLNEISSLQRDLILLIEEKTGADKEIIVDSALQVIENNPSVLVNAKKLIIVNGQGQNNSLQLNEDTSTTVSEFIMGSLPTDLKLVPRTRSIIYKDVVIELRAIDLDSKSRWAGKIDSISPSRVKMKIHDDINRIRLSGVQRLIGNIVAELDIDENGEIFPLSYHLTAVLATDREPGLFHKYAPEPH